MVVTAPRLFSSIQKLGVDLGSDRVRISIPNKGVVLDEPAVIALEKKTGKVIGIGTEAAAMKDRVGGQVSVSPLVVQGEIYDLQLAQTCLQLFIERLVGKTVFFHPTVVTAVPSASSKVAIEFITQVIKAAGAREVYTVEAPLAAAIGAGVPVSDASGTFMLHLGHSISEAAVVSLGSVVYHTSSSFAGARLLRGVQQSLQTEKSLLVSEEGARKVLLAVGSAKETISRSVLVQGKDVVSEHPVEKKIYSEDIAEAVAASVSQIEATVTELLSAVPAALTTDVIDKGLLLSGGLAQLQGLDTALTDTLGMPVSVVDSPELVVAQGLASVAQHVSEYRRSIAYQLTTQFPGGSFE